MDKQNEQSALVSKLVLDQFTEIAKDSAKDDIDFNCKEYLIIEPHIKLQKIEQVIARGTRISSHKDLPIHPLPKN